MKSLLIWSVVLLALLGPACYNGYPLVFSDTGTYIESGWEGFVPKDRPIAYGLFLLGSSLGLTLWLPILFQAIAVTWVLWESCRWVLPTMRIRLFALLVIILSMISGLGWYTSQLMPDVFTPLSLLGMTLLLLHRELPLWKKMLLAAVVIMAVNVHFSHYLIAGLTFLLILLAKWRSWLPESMAQRIRWKLAAGVLVGSLVCGSLVNYAYSDSFRITQGSHVYLMGRMLDSGVLKQFLEDRCGQNSYALCPYKDELPANNRELLWNLDSPLYQQGGWEGSRQAYMQILWGIARSPKHLGMFVYRGFTSGLAQLFQIDVGSGLITGWYANPNSSPYQKVAKYLPHELSPYLNSRQNENLWGQGLEIDLVQDLNRLATLLSLCIWGLLGLSRGRRLSLPPAFTLFAWVVLGGIIVNAFVTASLANVFDRLQARVSWMLIWYALMVVIAVPKGFWKEVWQAIVASAPTS
ncbi:MAG: hypothetical protein AAF399_03170 [Bacteroidota bacterium]